MAQFVPMFSWAESGLHSSHAELDRFSKLGLVVFDKKAQEVRVMEKGHVLGQILVPLTTLAGSPESANS